VYTHILLPLDWSSADGAALAHATQLAVLTGARISLAHVADGFAARYQEVLNLSDSAEIHTDRANLLTARDGLAAQGVSVEAYLAGGEPGKKIAALAKELGCDLIVMGTHGHKGLADLLLGSVADAVRHATKIPVLLVRVR
jgi:manganese transport protein